MSNDNRKCLYLFRSLSYACLILTCLFWLPDNGFPGYINWSIFVIGILLSVQTFAKVPVADGILGLILVLLSLYMLSAVISDLADHFNGTKPVNTFAAYFGIGYGIFTLTLLSSLAIIYSAMADRLLGEQT